MLGRTMAEIYDYCCHHYRRRTALVFGDQRIDFDHLAETANRPAALSRGEHLVDDSEEGLERLASCGRPTLATELRLLDDDSREVALGQPGEMVVKCPDMMQGYLNRPDLTAETIRDGWLHTGDVAYQDRNGFLYIVDRKKDMIVSGGFNVYPKEVEDILHEHPAMAGAVVFGVPDSKWGETVKALVVVRSGMAAPEKELLDFCKRRKGRVMAPKFIEFVESIPTTPLGKPDKKVIREKYWQNSGRRVG